MHLDARVAIQTGLEVFLQSDLPSQIGPRVGLITNPTGVDHRLHSSIDLLSVDPRIRLLKLLGPEHGIRGDAQAGVAVENAIDSRTQLPVYSLYGISHSPSMEALANLDTLIFDMQDIGVRYATYISTLFYTQQAAASANLTFVVFDRPNPLTGTIIEGPLLKPAFSSFVGIYALPVRHGLTIGELARLFAAEQGRPQPHVMPIYNWRRDLWLDQTDFPWVQPSPNLPTLDSVALYPGTCLLEGTNISEGRGTTRPFELLGAPWLDPFALLDELSSRSISGVAFRPAYFTPTFSKYAQTLCAGIQIHILEREVIRPVALGVHILSAIHKLYPENFSWQRSSFDRYFIDLLYGGDQLRHAIEADIPVADILTDEAAQTAAFIERVRPFLLYEPDTYAAQGGPL